MNSLPSDVSDLPVLARLDPIGLLIVQGEDAAPFLRSQATCDIRGLSEDCVGLGAFCSPKGRAVAVFRVLRHGGRFFLILRDDMLDAVRSRLQRYVLRARVELSDARERWAIFGLLGTGNAATDLLGLSAMPPPGRCTETAGGALVMAVDGADKFLVAAPRAAADALETAWIRRGVGRHGSASDWECTEIRDGIPTVTPATSEEFIPQMLNLDRLGGISFNKCCYTGQEVVARTHYLGTVKRRMHRFRVDCDRMPEPGTRLVGARDENPIGQVVAAAPAADSGYELWAVTGAEAGPGDAVQLGACSGPPLRWMDLPYLERMDSG